MKITNEKAFYDIARLTLFGGKITATQFARLSHLVAVMAEFGSVTSEMGAYILATAHHETDRFTAMVEYTSGEAYEGRDDLGNTEKGDGKRFKGRGYVHLTGRRNYTWGAEKVGLDLIEYPGRAADIDVAAPLIVMGMLDGSFTGIGLGRFINSAKMDFINARKTVNGLDRAELIADIAERYLIAIRGGMQVPSADEKPVPLSLARMPLRENLLAVPACPKPRFAHAVACGSSITVVWTAIASTGWLHPALAEPEVTVAISGILSSLASAFGLCNFFRPIPREENHQKGA